MKHVEYAYTSGMDDSKIEDRLQTAETGVLALAGDDDAYAVPLAHYYDGDSLYGAEPTDDPRGLDSWSIVVTGQLVELPETERERFDTADINRHFSPIRVFDEAIEDIEIAVVGLDIDTIIGRYTPVQ
jgi:nitroimidazol reductase NimA-like FMN-containing flavoprotein (pyridoxamine 5'-phosphate oxidase superfamily)